MCEYNPYLAGYEEPPVKKKKKKKKKRSKGGGFGEGNSIADRVINLAAGVAGGALGHFVVTEAVKMVIKDDPNKARIVKNVVNVVIGTGTALTVNNPIVQNLGAGLAGDGIIDGGLQVYQGMTKQLPATTKTTKNFVSEGEESNPDVGGYYDEEDDINGYYDEEDDINGYYDEEDDINGYYDNDEDYGTVGDVIDDETGSRVAVYGTESNRSTIPPY